MTATARGTHLHLQALVIGLTFLILAAAPGRVHALDGDLSSGPAAVSPSSIQPGGQINITATIANSGSSSVSVQIGVFLSPDSTIDVTDSPIGGNQTFSIPANGSSTFNENSGIPTATALGTWFVGLVIDPQNVIAETNETNNSVLATPSIQVVSSGGGALPDLVCDAPVVPTSAPIGGQIFLSGSVRNTAVSTGAPPSNAQYFLSLDQFIDAADPLLATEGIPSIASNGRFDLPNRGYFLSATLAAGNYFVALVADSDRTINEVDEQNNLGLSATKVTLTAGASGPAPDLVAEAVSGPAAAQAGGAIVVNGTVRNVSPNTGSPGCSADFFLSPNAGFESGDPILGTVNVPALGPSTFKSFNGFTFFVPSTLPGGSYFIGLLADGSRVVQETDESNNTGFSSPPTSISGGGSAAGKPDLIAENVTGPGSATAGGAISLSGTIRNLSPADPAPASRADFVLSVDRFIAPPDPFLSQVTVGALPANGSQSFTNITFTVPAAIAAGNYFAGLIADATQLVAESDENNNGGASVNTIGVAGGGGTSSGLPDLVAESISGPASNANNAQMALTGSFRNVGDAPAGAFDVGFALSASGEFNDGIQLSRNRFDGLPPAGQERLQLGVFVPAAVSPANYFVGMDVDMDKVVREVDENNNRTRSAAPVQITAGGGTAVAPDLVARSVTGPTTAQGGLTIALSGEVKNQGPVAATGFQVGFLLSSDRFISTADIPLGLLNVAGLASSEQTTLSAAFVLPQALFPGDYFAGMMVDPDQRVPETDESNNTASQVGSLRISPSSTETLADLVVGTLSGPLTATAGQAMVVRVSVKNSGSGDAGGFNLGLFLSSDSSVSPEDSLLAFIGIQGLPAGRDFFFSQTVPVPVTLAAGSYRLLAVADSQNTVAEAQESNNGADGGAVGISASGAPSVCTGPNCPDLVVEGVFGPAVVPSGSSLPIGGRVANRGGGPAGPFGIGFLLSADAVSSDGDVVLGASLFPGLAAGTGAPVDATVQLPATLASGNYFVGMIADNTGGVIESDEGNNVAISASQISISGLGPSGGDLPDLTGDLLVPPASLASGTVFGLNAAVKNSGTAFAPPFRVRFLLAPGRSFDPGLPVLGELAVDGGLLPGIVTPLSGQFVVPPVPSGTYLLSMVVDADNVVSEGNEGNNFFQAPAPTSVGGGGTSGNLPDLLPEFVRAPVSAAPGGPIAVSGAVRNIGSVDAAPFAVVFVLSQGFQASTLDVPLGRVSINGLGAGQAVPVDGGTTLFVPATIAPGAYRAGLVVDPDGLVAESDEFNNNLVNPSTLSIGSAGGGSLPDLVSSGVTAPQSASLGQAVRLTGRVTNQGTSAAGSSVAAFVLDGGFSSTTAGTVPAATAPLTTVRIGTLPVPSLAVGVSSDLTGTFVLPSFVQPGTYDVSLEADASFVLPESDEGNNRALAPAPLALGLGVASGGTVGGPDLVVSAVSAPLSASFSQPLEVQATVKNLGDPFAAGFSVGFRLSQSPLAARDALSFGESFVPGGLPRGGTATARGVFQAPSFLASGSYFIIAVADSANAVFELDEANNTSAAPTATGFSGDGGSALPDLIAAGVRGPAGAVPGQRVLLTGTVQNVGRGPAGPSQLGFGLVRDNTSITGGPPEIVELGEAPVATLPAGAFVSVTGDFQIPLTVAPGSYGLGIEADTNELVAESIEQNNQGRSGNLFQVGAAGGRQISLGYSADPFQVPAGRLLVRATFSEAAASTPTIQIDRPGDSNDVKAAPMTRESATEWTFSYNVLPQDGVSVFDGPAMVAVNASAAGGPFPQPFDNVITIRTSAGSDLVAAELIVNPDVPSPADAVIVAGAVESRGSAAVSAVFVELLVDGVPRGTQVVSIPPNARVTLPAIDLGQLAPGDHSISLVVDPGNSVPEGDELNNRIDRFIPVSTITAGFGTDFLSLSGAVKRSDGSAVEPGAQVVATNQRTSQNRSSLVDASGRYGLVFSGSPTQAGDLISVRVRSASGQELPVAVPNPAAIRVTDFQVRQGFVAADLFVGGAASFEGENPEVLVGLAGSGRQGFTADGQPAADAALNSPVSPVFTRSGDLFFCEVGSHRVRKVDIETGRLSTVAGKGIPAFSGDGGAATSATINQPEALAFDASGNLYIADSGNHRVRVVNAGTGAIATFAGTGNAGAAGEGGLATVAELNRPSGLAFDSAGQLHISDTANHRVLVVQADGKVRRVAGSGQAGFSGDGGLATQAQLRSPRGLAFDAAGNLLIADAGNNRIRRVDAATGAVLTVAGTGAAGFAGDGLPAVASPLEEPSGVFADALDGVVFVADSGNDLVREIDAEGRLQIEAGTGMPGRAADGTLALRAALRRPRDVTTDERGNLVIADAGNNRIVRLVRPGAGGATDDHPASASATTTSDDVSTDGVAEPGAVETAGDVDFLRFAAAAGETYDVEVRPRGAGAFSAALAPLPEAAVTLHAPDGSTVVAEGSRAFDPALQLATSGFFPPTAPGVRILGLRLTVGGTYYLRVRAADVGAIGAYEVEVRRQVRSGALRLALDVLPPAFSGTPYTPVLQVDGGVPPFTFAVLGALPPGITLDPDTGAFSGETSVVGEFPFAVEATDSGGAQARARRPYRISVLPSGGQAFPESGHPYPDGADESQSFEVPGPHPALDVTFDEQTATEGGFDFIHVTDGFNGEIVGSPFTGRQLAGRTVRVGGNRVTVRLVSDQSVSEYGYRVLAVAPALDGVQGLDLVPAALPPAQAETPFAATSVMSTRAVQPARFSVTGGLLPPGMTLSESGALSGTPQSAGEYAFTIGVKDAAGSVGARHYRLSVVAVGGTQFPESAHPYASNADETLRYTAPGSPASILVTFDPRTAVEPGYDFIDIGNGAGEPIPGSPFTGRQLAGRTLRVAGATVAIRLRSDRSVTDYGFRVERVEAASGSGSGLALVTASLPGAKVGVSYSATLETTGGQPPYSYAPDGPLPPGVFIDSFGGAVIGIPSRPGNFSVPLAVLDSAGGRATRSLPLVVTAEAPPRLTLSFERDGASLAATLALTGVSGSLAGVRASVEFDPKVLEFDRFVAGGLATASEISIEGQSTAGRLDIDVPAPPAITQNGTLLVLLFRVTGGIDLPERAVVLSSARFGTAAGSIRELRPTANPGFEQLVQLKRLPGGALAPEVPNPVDPLSPKPWVTLDGRESHDANIPPLPLSYSWSQVTSFPITLSGAATPLPTFVPSGPGFYQFELVVSNGRLESFPARVGILVDENGCGPTVDPRILIDRARGVRSEPDDAPPQFGAGRGNITLDATLSVAGGDSATDTLTYSWTQTGGPGVELSPSTTAAQPSFFPQQGGLYEFELTARGSAGCQGPPRRVRAVVFSGEDTPPRLSVQASASTTTDVGDDVGEGDESKLARSLRVEIPTVVTLKAVVTDPDVGRAPLRQRLTFDWSQVSGPVVALTTSTFQNTEALVSAVQFEPTTSRVHVFRCVVSQLDSSGVPTGVSVSRQIRVIVSSVDTIVPEAAFEIFEILESGKERSKGSFPQKTLQSFQSAKPRAKIRLDARRSRTRTTRPNINLSYIWTQVAGPRVTLSNPFSRITTFVVPRLPSLSSSRLRFQLIVDNGRDQSEPAVGGLDVSSPVTRTASLGLARGLSLVSMPVSNETTVRTLGDLIAGSGASFAVRTENGRFRVSFPSSPEATAPLEPGAGYLLSRNRTGAAQRTLGVPGLPWPDSPPPRVRQLSPGLNLIGYPNTTLPTGFDAEALRRLAGARSVTRIVPSTSGLGVSQVYLPNLSPSFQIESGSAYLLSVPAARSVTLPASE
ncbi:MAG: putative Ig domain-containing protein [Candidatus Wallbacteria bacterium]|nr:putative Ig domain-containing protein [Candidatus Wallbacteria bacterium]